MKPPLSTVCFDTTPPRGRSSTDHFTHGEWGVGAYLLKLADACPGFRVVVVSPGVAAVMEAFVTDAKIASGGAGTPSLESRHRHGWPRLIGSWRGHEVYSDPDLEEGIAYLSTKVGGDRLGIFQLVKSEAHS
jgi:hypothetical protein